MLAIDQIRTASFTLAFPDAYTEKTRERNNYHFKGVPSETQGRRSERKETTNPARNPFHPSIGMEWGCWAQGG